MTNRPNRENSLYGYRPFLPEWAADAESSYDPLSSSPPMPILGQKRTRLWKSSIEIDPPFKQMRIENNWNAQLITISKDHNYGLLGCMRTGHYLVANPHFFPKYIGDRLPLPEDMISNIYNNYLNDFDRRILEGEHVLCKTKSDIANYAGKFDKDNIGEATSNSWYISMYNIYDANPNSPE